MKDILSLTKTILDKDYYASMFEAWGSEKNILFVSPQLSGKHLYKSIIPFFCLRSKKGEEFTVSTAITSLKRYDYKKQLMDFEIDINDEMVDWADYIVFPFTTQPLVSEIYARIRELKPEVKIVYSVDFNFYELSYHHPYKEIFSEETVMNDVEDNMYFADLVLLDNMLLLDYMGKKFKTLMEDKYKGIESNMTIAVIPTMIDSEIVLKNVEGYEPQSTSVVKKETIHEPAVQELIEETEKVKEDLKQKEPIEKEKNNKNEPIKNKPVIKSPKVVKNGKSTAAAESGNTEGKPRKSNGKSNNGKSTSGSKPRKSAAAKRSKKSKKRSRVTAKK